MIAALIATACIAVKGPRITAADLTSVVPGFAPADKTAMIAYSPRPGVQRTMHAAELRRILTQFGYTGPVPENDICFSRPVQPLSADQVRSAMQTVLGAAANIDVLEVSAFPAPKGQIVFPRDQLHAAPIAVWNGYVLYDGDQQFPIWARVAITIKTRQAVAKEQLRPGVPIRADQIIWRDVDGPIENRATPQNTDEIAGYIPRRFVSEDAPVWRDEIDPPNEVSRGDRVSVIVSSGRAHLQFDAEAQSAARRGDMVMLRNSESGKIFRARVCGPDKARIDTLTVNP